MTCYLKRIGYFYLIKKCNSRNISCVISQNYIKNLIFLSEQPNIYQTTNFLYSRRWKSKRSKSSTKKNLDDEYSDSDTEEDSIVGKGVEVKTSVVGSMRADLLLKIGLGMARNKVEEAFYESRIRLNSKKIFKKSSQVRAGDEVDIIKGVSPKNPLFIQVGRIEVLEANGREGLDGIEVKLRRSKSLVIDNYPEGDPWKPSESVPTS